MKLACTRFGSIDIAEEDVLEFPRGVLGFDALRRFVLLPHRSSLSIAWLQSIDSPDVALPVVSAHAVDAGYDEGALAVHRAALGGSEPTEVAILLVLSATPGLPPTVNRRAPILVDAGTRRGAQILLDGAGRGTRDSFVMATPEPGAATASAA